MTRRNRRKTKTNRNMKNNNSKGENPATETESKDEKVQENKQKPAKEASAKERRVTVDNNKQNSHQKHNNKSKPHYKVCYKDENEKVLIANVSFEDFYNFNVTYNENLEDAVGDILESGGVWVEEKIPFACGAGVEISNPLTTKKIIPLHKIQSYIPDPESLKSNQEKSEKQYNGTSNSNETVREGNE
jgi:hypothetical protein